jgi:hypothetical protein
MISLSSKEEGEGERERGSTWLHREAVLADYTNHHSLHARLKSDFFKKIQIKVIILGFHLSQFFSFRLAIYFFLIEKYTYIHLFYFY